MLKLPEGASHEQRVLRMLEVSANLRKININMLSNVPSFALQAPASSNQCTQRIEKQTRIWFVFPFDLIGG